MKFKLILSILFLFWGINANATNKNQSKYISIDITVPQSLGNTTAYFAHYIYGQPYAIDSTSVYKDGKYTLNHVLISSAGEYLVYLKPNIQLPLLLQPEDKDISIDIIDLEKNKIEIKGNKNTEILWNFNVEAIDILNDKRNLENKLSNNSTGKEKDLILKQIQDQNKKLNILIDNYEQQYPESFLKDYFHSKKIIELPFSSPNKKEESTANINFLRKNYWENINLNNPNLWNGPTIYEYLDEYLQTIVHPEPDSVAFAVSEMASMITDEKVQENFLTYMINTTSASNRVGQENIWAKLTEDFIIDKNHPWVDSLQYQKLMQEYSIIKNNRIGSIAKNVKAYDMDNNPINSNDIDADYLILYFYSPNCGHCSTETPIIHELLKKYKDYNIKVFAFNTIVDNPESWKNFVEANNMQDWINVTDPEYKSSYWLNYDVRGVPSTYVLDKDKKILIKKIDSKNLEYFLDTFL